MKITNKLNFAKAALQFTAVVLLTIIATPLLAQDEHIKIDGSISGSAYKAYVYVIIGYEEPQFHKSEIKNGRFELSLNKPLKDTVLHAGLFLSGLAEMNKTIYERELKAKKINSRKDLYWFLIDSTTMHLTVNPAVSKIKTYGGQLNREQALNDSIITQYYKDVDQRGTDYANKKRILAELKVINDHNSSLLSAENLRNLINLPLPGGAYPYKDEILAVLKNMDEKAIGKDKIDNMQTLYDKMVKRYTPKENVIFPAVNFTNAQGGTLAYKDLTEGCDYILIDFWATWCGPCRQQHPQLKKIQEQFKSNKKLKIVGVALDRQIKTWQTYLKTNPFNYTQYWITPATEGVLKENLGYEAIPCYVLVNTKTGMVTDFNIGIDNIVAKLKEKGL
ncbi:TlpA family protein disulfide reductase [Mucilaginibacter lacusdianchii]|uniref:TlpA family protein disulfide reductase n=1 Tax=Mucilaginibacter lacusdianchii TaxID=2684211 RepID=UPI00131ADEEB|nr:TlpA disulfide reductase family protein [Mucilaginibacter sp. JXJ CY 39]